MKNKYLLFSDDFDGTEIDSAKWARCPEEARQGGAAVWDSSLSFLDGNG